VEQPGLFGDALPPPRLKRPAAPRAGLCRLFFALFPNEAAIEEMHALAIGVKDQFRLSGKLHARSRLHLTLDHLGDFAHMPHDIVRAACAAASEVQAPPGGFSVQLDRVLSFGRHAETLPLVLKDSGTANQALKQFRSTLWDALAVQSVPGGSRTSFTPHVTLLYDARVVPEQSVQPVTWPVNEFVLLHSAMRETRYEVLGRWPCGAAPGTSLLRREA
jgi:2'-5' RNA ligase